MPIRDYVHPQWLQIARIAADIPRYAYRLAYAGVWNTARYLESITGETTADGLQRHAPWCGHGGIRQDGRCVACLRQVHPPRRRQDRPT